ncbi:hypothetical protein [Fodinibius halophilus]|uniref:Uncharacterized protein n=1 Tax=Fodinibius halophilus TaxID=1736908 RepID=A0A6M1T6B3_9BACT|nr:hypothetical protein [Fodinibius halophilus]NGP87561.1 hypothetical protein [Fodinibius halophilus]
MDISNFSPIYNHENGFKKLDKDLKYIAVTFLSVLLLVDSTTIMSTDYIDHLEMGLTPPDESQYSIMPRIQQFINEYLKTYDNELVDFIKKISFMNIH